MKYLQFILFGILGGIIGGMGMGGGTLLIPLLTGFLNIGQLEAQAINLISFIPMAFVSLIFHIKNKLVDFKALFKVLPFALVASVFSSFFALKIEAKILRQIFGVFLLLIGMIFLLKIFKEMLVKILSPHKNPTFFSKMIIKINRKSQK